MIEVYEHNSEWAVIPHNSKGHSSNESTGVSVIHLPSALRADCNIYSSAHKNKDAAKEAISKNLKVKR